MEIGQLLLGHVQIDRRGLQVPVAEQLLNGAQIDSRFEEMGGEAVAERLNTLLIHRRPFGFATGIIRFSVAMAIW